MKQTAAGKDPESDDRRRPDRRRHPSPALSRYTFVGRRRAPRRTDDGTHNYYVDRPRPEAWWNIVLLLALSITDAFLSLKLFADGRSEELNPLLLLTLGYGNIFFITFKLLLTLVGIFVLLLHWHWVVRRPWMNVRVMARVLIGIYATVVFWEILLLSL